MEDNNLLGSPAQLIEKFRNSATGRGVAARARVAKLAKTNPGQAAQEARCIEHPWYRCQAISSIVEAHPRDGLAKQLLNEAFEAAYSQTEPNRVAAVSLWPLRLLVGLDANAAAKHTSRLVQVIEKEPHGLRKLHGLSAILIAVVSMEELRGQVLPQFVSAARESQGWRTERIIDVVAEVLAPYDRVAAIALLKSRNPSRYTKRSRELLSLTGSADTTALP